VTDPNSHIARFLVFCAGSSPDLLAQCPTSEWIKHTSTGLTVLFTSLLAMLSAFFAFQVVLDNLWLSLPLSLLWALIIFNLDRFIVASFRKQGDFWKECLQAIPRMLLAGAIAIVVARPLELEIFRSEVRQILAEQRTEKLETMRRAHEERLSVHDTRTVALKEELDGYFRLREKYYQEYICECDGTCGTGLKGRGSECKAKQSKYEEYVREFDREKARIDAALAGLTQDRARITVEYTEARKLAETAFSEGFLARLQALGKLGTLASFAITLLLMLVEITPILSKLLAPEGPYDNLVRISEHEFKIKFMRTVYQQNMDLHGSGSPSKRRTERSTLVQPNPDPTDVRNRYAELRRQLRTKTKNR
jgi:hypothetical protein